MSNIFEWKENPLVKFPCQQSEELKCMMKDLGDEIISIFGEVSSAKVFVDRTIYQKRCSIGPCQLCNVLCSKSLICGGCQRRLVMGDDVINNKQKTSKQLEYFRQFKTQMLLRAKKVVIIRNRYKATEIQKIVRGYLVRTRLTVRDDNV